MLTFMHRWFCVDTLSCVALSLKGMYKRTFFLRFSKNAHFIHYHTFFRNVPWVVKGYLDDNCRLLKVEMVSCLTLQWSMWSDLLRSKSSKVNSLDLFAHIVARIRPCKAFNFTHVLGFKEAYLTLSKGIHLICFWQSSIIAAYSLPPLPLPAEKEKSVSEEEKTVDRFLKVPPLMVIKFGLIFSFFLLISSPHLCAATLSFSFWAAAILHCHSSAPSHRPLLQAPVHQQVTGREGRGGGWPPPGLHGLVPGGGYAVRRG